MVTAHGCQSWAHGDGFRVVAPGSAPVRSSSARVRRSLEGWRGILVGRRPWRTATCLVSTRMSRRTHSGRMRRYAPAPTLTHRRGLRRKPSPSAAAATASADANANADAHPKPAPPPTTPPTPAPPRINAAIARPHHGTTRVSFRPAAVVPSCRSRRPALANHPHPPSALGHHPHQPTTLVDGQTLVYAAGYNIVLFSMSDRKQR